MRISRVAAATLVAAAFVTVGVGPALWRPLSLKIQLPEAHATAERLLDLWRVTGPESGGFASVSVVDPSFDLYATAWNLRLARAYQIDLPPNLDTGRIQAELLEIIRDPTTEENLPPLEVVRLTVSASRDLGVVLPSDTVVDRLAELRSGSGFAFYRREDETDAAMSSAVSTMTLASVEVPEEVKVEIRTRLAASLQHTELQQFANSTIPIWLAADLTLPSEERLRWREELASLLTQLWRDLLTVSPWDGPMLALALDSLDVARANGIPTPTFDGTAQWAALERSDGYLAVSAESPSSDPQATATAALLGRQAPKVLARAIAAAASPLGWQMTGVETPGASTMAEYVLEEFGLDTHRAEITAQCDAWLTALKNEVQDSASLRQHVEFLAAYNRLAHVIGAETWVPEARSWEIDLTEWDSGDVGSLTRTLVLAGEKPGTLVDALAELPWGEPESVQDALDTYLVAHITGQSDLTTGAIAFLETVRVGDLYRASSQVDEPDLRSTAIAYAILGEGSMRAARRFANDRGFGLIVGQSPQREGPTLESLFLGVGLAVGFDNPALLQ